MKISKILIIAYLLLNVKISIAQQVKQIKFCAGDSSIYSICKLPNSQFVLGGENGYLAILDSSLKVQRVNFPFSQHIYAIVVADSNIYIAGNKGLFVQADLTLSNFHSLSKISYRKKAFLKIEKYNEQLFLFGGNHKTSKGKIGVPKGVVVEYNTKSQTLKTIHQKKQRFFWGTELHKDTLYFAGSNGLNSKIYKKAINASQVIQGDKIPMLITDVGFINNNEIVAGSKSFLLGKGILHYNGKVSLPSKIGAIWKVETFGQIMYLSTDKGFFIGINKKREVENLLKCDDAIYNFELVSSNKFIAVGRGVYLVDFGK